jgi:4-amino-4-deoxy-L-arabinose transferase-like glycosyltransferase
MDAPQEHEISLTAYLFAGALVLVALWGWGLSGAVLAATVGTAGLVMVRQAKDVSALAVTLINAIAGHSARGRARETSTEASAGDRLSVAQAGVRVRAAVAGLATLALAGLIAFMYLDNLGTNPAGLFCDEAMIGLQAARLLKGEPVLTPNVFFYQHFGHDRLGSLAIFATAPFVALLGLTDQGIRLTSAVLMVATVAVVYLTLRRLATPFAVLPAALFAMSPVVIHLARINFAHGPSLLALAIAYWLYVEARLRGRLRWAVAAGTALGLSAYGYSGFLIASPLLLVSLVLVEFMWNRRRWREYAVIAVMGSVFVLWLVPVVHRMVTDEFFFERMRLKGMATAGMPIHDHLFLMIRNYPKYFSWDFLFVRGESGMPGGFISRHSVLGAGELSRAAIPLLALGCVGMLAGRRRLQARFFAPFFIFAALYPAPDLITTSDGRPPYVFAVASGTIAIPFMAGMGMHGLAAMLKVCAGHHLLMSSPGAGRNATPGILPATEVVERRGSVWTFRLISVALLATVVLSGWRFWTGPYHRYPLVSADYWGWQYGPRPMIQYFLAHQEDYDQFVMDGDFNEAWVFLDVYIRDAGARRKAVIGDISALDTSKRQLFGMRAERWQRLVSAVPALENVMRIRAVVRYPNGQDAMYLVDVDPARVIEISPS